MYLMLPLPLACQLNKRCWSTGMSLSRPSPPSSLAQSWQYWRWSCWVHYSPGSAALKSFHRIHMDPQDPTQSQEFSREDQSQSNVTQSNSECKGKLASFHPGVFQHLHPSLHCIEGSLPAMALALRLWRWEIRKWVSKHYRWSCNRCTNIFHFFSPSFTIFPYFSFFSFSHWVFTTCSTSARCVWALHVEDGIPQWWARPKLGTHRLPQQMKRVAPMAWHHDGHR